MPMPTFPITPALRHLLETIRAAGGRPYVVGGAVRDCLMGRAATRDVDVEVFRLSLAELEAALAARFRVDAVGRSFGVLKVAVEDVVFDVSVPRAEVKTGRGHRAFHVEPEPQLNFAAAASRRDLTINAIGWDPEANRFEDPHGGIEDIARCRIRHVGPAFAEDPLRVLRVCRFAARFDFTIDPTTLALCRTLRPELTTLPVERLWEEWKKLLLESKRPAVGLDALVSTESLTLFPNLQAMLHVAQDPEWHPEGQDHVLGSLWVHTGLVVDAAVRVLADDAIEDEEERLIVLLGALCHDLGKPSTTEFRDGRWRSLGHESAGEAPARSFLAQIGCPPRIIEAVVPLVLDHLKPFDFYRGGASSAAIRRLALRVPIPRLCRVARADFLGRTTPEALACTDSRELESITWLLERADELNVIDAAPKPLLMGRHLLALGVHPGTEMGTILKAAFEAQLEGSFSDETGALDWAKQHLGP